MAANSSDQREPLKIEEIPLPNEVNARTGNNSSVVTGIPLPPPATTNSSSTNASAAADLWPAMLSCIRNQQATSTAHQTTVVPASTARREAPRANNVARVARSEHRRSTNRDRRRYNRNYRRNRNNYYRNNYYNNDYYEDNDEDYDEDYDGDYDEDYDNGHNTYKEYNFYFGSRSLRNNRRRHDNVFSMVIRHQSGRRSINFYFD